MRAPRICAYCGAKVAYGMTCICQRRRDQARKAKHDQHRPNARERGYDTKWDRERKAYLAAHPTCVRCGAPSEVVDHIIPHKGNLKLFWNRNNWQPLCTSCHSRSKQREESRGVVSNFAKGTPDQRGLARVAQTGLFRGACEQN